MAGTLFTSAMRTVMASPFRDVIPVLEIDDVGPSATDLRFAPIRRPVASASLGYYDNRVLRFGTWARKADDPKGALQAYTGEIVLDNMDGALTQYLHQFYKRVARLKLVSPMLTSTSDYFTVFNGVVGNVRTERQSIVLTLRQDDEKINAPFPKRRLTKSDHPNIHKRAVGLPVPILYGRFSTDNILLPERGAVECPMVDVTGFGKYILAGHICKTVPRVYADDTLKTVTTHYTLDYPIIAGQQYTRINGVSGGGFTSSVIVTADVDGAESTGTGTGGTLQQNAATILKLMIVNWMHGEYRAGAYFADATAPVDATLFSNAATFITNFLGSQFARRIGEEQRRGVDEINQFAESFGSLIPIWTNAGQIGLVIWDHTKQDADVYPADRIVESWDVIDGEIDLQFDEGSYTPRVLTSYLPRVDENQNERFLYSAETQDATSSITAQEQRAVRWFAGEALGHFQAWLTDSWGINRNRAMLPGLRTTLGLQYLDYELMSDFGVTWARGPNEDGTQGWGNKVWQRRLFRLVGVDLDLDALRVRATLRDAQAALSSFWHVWKNNKRVAISTTVPEEGIIKHNLGQFEVVTRGSTKQTDDPAGTVVTLANDIIPADKAGLVIETARTNGLLRSSAVSGLTGITTAGTGTNGSNITAETTPLFFETASTNCWKFLAGNPMAAELSLRNTTDTASYSANARVVCSFDHLDDSGAILYWRLQRLVDNWFWNEAGQAWQAGSVDNALTNRTTTAESRDKSGIINVGAGATALRLFVLQQTGGTASRINYLFHFQVEEGRCYTTRIVTDGSAQTRAADTVKVLYDGGGKRLIPLTRNTIECRVKPFWNSADLASGDTKLVWDLQFDSNNALQLFYNQTTAAWRFKVRSGGTDYNTEVAHTVSRDTEYTITTRMTSSEGELGLGNLTASIFVGTTKGTDVTFVVPTYAASQSVYIGGATGAPATLQFDGVIVSIRVSPFAWPDALVGRTFPR